ncbi:hypothetical protein [Microvirga calopogonii]|uniref:hypothetical protein n=1 Tax=Microvirga calopogonii TaxID=2078013 RepID=UPI0013B35750|nr:hypothetical protein [Microvirga calopogonii]
MAAARRSTSSGLAAVIHIQGRALGVDDPPCRCGGTGPDAAKWSLDEAPIAKHHHLSTAFFVVMP